MPATLATVLLVAGPLPASAAVTGAPQVGCDAIARNPRNLAQLESAFVGPGDVALTDGIPPLGLPVFCRIRGTISAVRGSRIGFELWLPVSAWNGRLLMLGNGGYSSALPIQEMTQRLREGYAVTATDTGHTGDDPGFAVGHPAAIADWGHRAVHQTIVAARRLLRDYYGREASYRYFNGCSTGGHQGLMEAQRYPNDFDGIVAGAPGNNRTHLNAGFLWQFAQNHSGASAATALLAVDQLAMLAKASLAACRPQNGVVTGGLPSDPYLNDPLQCRFDPASLACDSTGASGARCLSPAQVQAARRMYDGARNPATHQRIYFGWPPGSEASVDLRSGWHLYWADPTRQDQPVRSSFWRAWAFDDAQWQWQSFDFDRDMQRTDDRLAATINAMSPRLDSFANHGGKLLQYHGMADPVVPFGDSVSFHDRVLQDQRRRHRGSTAGAARQMAQFYRLFLVPGLGHCSGGAGAAPTQVQSVMEAWVEKGAAPMSLPGANPSGGTNGKGFTRPLCPYPQIARYDGQGDPDAAGSFQCVAPLTEAHIEQPAPEYLR